MWTNGRKNQTKSQAVHDSLAEDQRIIGRINTPVYARLKRHGYKVLFAGIGIFFVVGISVWIYLANWANNDPKVVPSLYANESYDKLKKPNEPNTNVEQIVRQYGPDFDASFTQVTESNPAKWDKTMVDKAYLCLLYTEKISEYGLANQVLFALDIAGVNGVDIDDNSWGVGKGDRDRIRAQVPPPVKPGGENE